MKWGLIGVAILLVLLLCQFIGWRYVFFNLINENPPSNILPTSQSTIVYTFNRELASDSSIKVKGTDNPYRVNINNDTLRLIFTKPLKENDIFSLEITAASSDENRLVFSRHYQVKYLDFNQLPAAEQQRQTQESDSFEGGYPLIDQLPIITSDFEISYITPDTNEKVMSLTVLCKNIDLNNLLNSKPAEDTSCLPEAKGYLKNLGYDENSYVILSELKSHGAKRTH